MAEWKTTVFLPDLHYAFHAFFFVMFLSARLDMKKVYSLLKILWTVAAESLAKPLMSIFNLSLTSGIVPPSFKYAVVISLPKVPHPNFSSEFRPISNLCPLTKIFNKLVCTQILDYIETYDLLTNNMVLAPISLPLQLSSLSQI